MTKTNGHGKKCRRIGDKRTLTSTKKSAIMQVMNVVFRARNEKFPRRRQQYVIGLSRAFVEARAAAGKGGRGSIKREAAFH